MAELINTRVAYGKALIELGRSNPDVVVLSADVSNSDHSFMFADVFPDRFINTGIAEQSLVDCAVGLALAGKIPFVNTFGVFLATRAVEMIRTHVCYGRANVKLMAAYGGLSPSFEGPTHHATEDIAILRSFPRHAGGGSGRPLRPDRVAAAGSGQRRAGLLPHEPQRGAGGVRHRRRRPGRGSGVGPRPGGALRQRPDHRRHRGDGGAKPWRPRSSLRGRGWSAG